MPGPTAGQVVDGYRFRGGDPNNRASWEPVAGGAQSGPAAAGFTDLGGGWYRGPNGGSYQVGRGGAMVERAAPAANTGASTSPLVGADARARFMIGLGPMTEAQVNLSRAETASGRRINPFNRDWGARLAEAIPFDSGSVARMIGGQDYQEYEQAARSYEASIMPILSGAAVTPQEAQRLARADLPQLGDTPDILELKSRNRAMRINAAAAGVGQEAPFPDLNAPARRRASASEQQVAYFRSNPANPQSPRGSRERPFAEIEGMNWRNLPPGSFFVDRQGVLRTVPAQREAQASRLRNQSGRGNVTVRRVQ
jgi:hypothetical protein